MRWNESKTMLVGLLAALSACAGTVGNVAPASERIEAGGISARRVAAESQSPLQFTNTDAEPHQIYSNDCPELSSTVIQPGQGYVARLGRGPKTCHFEDLLAPGRDGYWGTVDVGEDPVTIEATPGG